MRDQIDQNNEVVQNQSAVNEVLDKQESALQEIRKAVLSGLQSIHEALNPEQRKLVGELIEFGPRAMHGGGAAEPHDGHSW